MSRRPLVSAVLLLPVVLLLGLAAFAPAQAVAQEDANGLPLKKVVMFNSGVGFFEHRGQVEGDARVELKFNVEDVNDLLKSMVVQDLGGGKISTVSYGSKDPITRTLKTFAIDLTSNPSLADLLEQVRGEKVQIDAPNPVVGTIVGVEHRKQKVNDDEAIEVSLLNLLTDEGLRSVSLETVGRIKLLNEKLDAELRKALMVLAMSHSTDKKSVALEFTGKGNRQVRVGYIQEAPIWKTSYRLVLKDDGQPFLQGWAIVENTTEEDWNGVNLTLVSGRPISFMMDLYEPLYVPRPVVEPELFASLRPQKYGQDLAEKAKEFDKLAKKPNAPPADAAFARRRQLSAEQALKQLAGRAGGGGRYADEKLELERGVESVAQAGDVGELFQYEIEAPVTLPRQQSAMLPIVNGEVKADKVSIYNESVQAKHPLNGLQLTNSTGLHLMQGPITVFDGGVYAGDAQIEDLQPGTTRLVSYALDLDTEVAHDYQGKPEQLVSCRLVRGVLYASRKYERTQKYVVKNSGDQAKKVLIEYPRDTTWKLVAPEKPDETTRDLYRFAVQAEPGKPANLEINEEYTATQQVVLSNTPEETIRLYINAKVVSQTVKDALAEVIRRKQALAELSAERQRLENQIKVIGQEQDRIRQNMAQLARNSDLYNRYVKKFTEQEDKIESLRVEIARLIGQEAEQQKSLNDYLSKLTLE